MDWQAIFADVLSNPERAVGVATLMALRPLGLLYGFTLVVWAIGYAIMLRMAVALPLGLFVFAGSADQIWSLLGTLSAGHLALAGLVEFGIGFAFGFVSSAPFFALLYAGSISDQFRGENNTGLVDPAGGEANTFALFYLITGALIFFSLGGFNVLLEGFLFTYGLIAVGTFEIAFASAPWRAVIGQLHGTLVIALATAAPLMVLLIATDVFLAFAQKLAPRIGLADHSFLVKNLVAIAVLPLIALMIARNGQTTLDGSLEALPLFREVLR